MTTSVCNVTVTYERHTIDVALPTHLPVADVLPALLRHLPAARNATADPHQWALSPIGDAPLTYDTTLDAAGVTDGSILLLTTVQDAPAPARQEHLLDIVADQIDATTSRWSAHTTGELVTTTTAGLNLLLLATLPAAFIHHTSGLTAVAAMTVLSAAAAVIASRQTRIGSAALLISAAAQAAVLGAAWNNAGTAVPALAATAVAVITAATARGNRRNLDGPALAVTVFAVPLAAAGNLSHPTGPAVMVVVLLLTVGVLPRFTAGAGGLATLAYRLRSAGRIAAEDVTLAVHRSSNLLAWALTGLSAAELVLAATLTRTGQPWPTILTVVVTLAYTIRARLFTRITHVLPMLIAGITGLAAAAVTALETTATAAQTIAAIIAGALALLAAAIGSRPVREATAARLRQLTGMAEAVLVAACIPILAQSLGLFTAVGDLFR